MVWYRTLLKWSVPLLSLIVIVQSQGPGMRTNFDDIITNFCDNLSTPNVEEDNLSCVDVPIEQGQIFQSCFNRDLLCNGNNDCTGGEDEGNNVALSSLECNTVPPQFSCRTDNIPLIFLCDGEDDCSGFGIEGADELVAICDNKCLLPYYGGCPYGRICENSRSGVNCQGCVEGLVDADPSPDLNCICPPPTIDIDPSLFFNCVCPSGSIDNNPSPNVINCVCLPGFVDNDPTINLNCIPIPVTITITAEVPTVTVQENTANIEVCFQATVPSGSVPFTSGCQVIVTPNSPADLSIVGSITLIFSSATNVARDCVTVDVIDDQTPEDVEAFIFSLINVPAGSIVGFPSTTTLFITDNDGALFSFSTDTFSGTETSRSLTATIQLSIALSTATSIFFSATVAGFAVGQATPATAADFTVNTFQVDFAAGQTFATVSVIINDDTIIEDTERMSLSIFSPSLGQVAPGQGTAVGLIGDNDNPAFCFSPIATSVVEGSGFPTANIIVNNGLTFGPGVTRSIRVDTNINGIVSAATAGSDYTGISNDVENIGSTSFPYSYGVLEDTIDEPAEMYNLALSVPFGVTGSSVDFTCNTLTVTILDNDLRQFSYQSITVTVTEGVGVTAEVCVNLLAGTLSGAVTITLNPTPGTALSPGDFLDQTMFITFPANTQPGQAQAQQCASFTISNDNTIEGFESFTVVASPPGDFIGGATAFVNIIDDDAPTFEFSQVTFSTSEGNSPALATIRLAAGSGVLSQAITVTVSTLSTGTATPSLDFVPVFSTILTFPAGSGQFSSQNFPVVIIDDDIVEYNDETINIRATSSSGTFVGGGNTGTGQITITDDDDLVIGFQLLEYRMVEELDQVVCLEVISGSLAFGITVSAAVSTSQVGVGGAGAALPATAGIDYAIAPVPAVVSFSFGNLNSQCVNLDIIDDDINEPDEVFQVFAQPDVGELHVTVQVPQALVVIVPGADFLVFRFYLLIYNVPEQGPAIQICIDLTLGVVGPSGCSLSVVNNGGVAIAGLDYAPINANLFFPPGSAPGQNEQACFSFQPINDPDVEFTEDIVLLASLAIGATCNAQFTQAGNSATINIIDDDDVGVMIVPPPGIFIPEYTVGEGVGTTEVCVQLSGFGIMLGRPVMIILRTADGTAEGGAPGVASDYRIEEYLITINPGEETMQFCRPITINDDNICEGSENFFLDLVPVPDGGARGTNSPGVCTINDNDVAYISAAGTYSAPENGGTAMVPIVLMGQKADGRQCVVTVTTMDDEAVSIGLTPDYVGSTQTLVFDNQNILQSAEIELIDDGMCEGNEEFQLFLSTTSPGCEIEPGLSPIIVEIEDDEIGTTFGDDPHFSIVLPSGKLLCYTVQGEHGFAFNLISNKKMTMNARFVPDSRRSEVTWIGSMGIVVRDNTYKQANATALRFEALEKKMYIGDKVELAAKNIERLTFHNGKLTISEAPPTTGFKYPSIYVDLQDVEISFTMKFMNEHLDLFWHQTGGKLPDSHGLIGQFFRKGVAVDEVRKILIMPNKEPVPVMRRPVWSFMEREKMDDQLCWTAMNPGYQGEGLIDGTYYDYLVDDVMTTEYQYKKQQ